MLFIIEGCKPNAHFSSKQKAILEFTKEKNIYAEHVFYFSNDSLYSKALEIPKVKIFDSNGIMLSGGNCANYLDDLILKMGDNSLVINTNQDSINYHQFLNRIKLVSLDNLESVTKADIHYRYYVFYNWTSAM